jgi:hypothetical protein
VLGGLRITVTPGRCGLELGVLPAGVVLLEGVPLGVAAGVVDAEDGACDEEAGTDDGDDFAGADDGVEAAGEDAGDDFAGADDGVEAAGALDGVDAGALLGAGLEAGAWLDGGA